MQPRKEECYFCGRSEDDEGVWLKPTPDGEEFICEECEQDQMGPPPDSGYDAWRERQWDAVDDLGDF